MSLDQLIKGAIRSAVTYLATDGLMYRTGPTGSWSPLVAKFHADATQIVGYDDDHRAITATSSAHIKVPDGGTVLAVNGAGSEWQVQQADLTEWAVVGTSRHLGQTFYTLSRVVPLSFGMARGEVAQ